MKPSYYNNYIPVGQGTEILYNTLSGAILVVDEETKPTIENIQKAEIGGYATFIIGDILA